ncbi:DUF4834 family protein [uncultured Alistipes sp.]|uniref:DUF4834 family protein n=1 Tax=uncultured Alistipes sp. TaxID=538949 RepID=UPI002626FAD4|nr:DUF4834 family protein [uncultured Alistipes sp.]
MGILTAILDALLQFIRRNPLTCLILVILALTAPALLKGIALFILYFLLGMLVLGVVLTLLFRWRIRKLREGMEEQFGRNGEEPFGRRAGERSQRTGTVRIRRTSDAPEKRVASDVGDYVEFEETHDER